MCCVCKEERRGEKGRETKYLKSIYILSVGGGKEGVEVVR